MGKFEDEPFRKGTRRVAEAMAGVVGRDRRRRRRDGRGRRAVRLRRRDDPRLDRRRGLPGVARRKSVQLAPGDSRSTRVKGRGGRRAPGRGVRSPRPSKANDGMNEERTSSAHRAARLGVLDSADRPLVTPSLLNCDFARMAEELEALREAGAVAVHLDVMDGHFVPNLSYGPPVIADWRKRTDFPFDAHLMISEPARYLDDFVRAGVDVVIVHIEAVPEPVSLAATHPGLGLPGVAGAEPADAGLGDRALPRRAGRGPRHERDARLRGTGVRGGGAREGPRDPDRPARPADLDRRGDQPVDRRRGPCGRGLATGRRIGRLPQPMATTRRPWPSWSRAPAAAVNEEVAPSQRRSHRP